MVCYRLMIRRLQIHGLPYGAFFKAIEHGVKH